MVTRRDLLKKLGALAGLAGAAALGDRQIARAASDRTLPARQTPPKGQVGIEWLGHGSFRFTSCNGKTILLDPWISTNPKCPTRYRDKGVFNQVALVLWTHGHVDHFMLPDAKTLVAEYKPQIVAPWELSFFIKAEIPEADCKTFALGNKGATTDFDGIKITMVEAFHSAGAQLTGFVGTNHFVGEAVGYIIEFENGLRVYHSGDTALMGDMKTIIGDYYQPDIAILPIGGVFTMGPQDAAYACKLIRPKVVIPEHYGTFPVLVSSSEDFKRQLDKYAVDVKMHPLVPGEPKLF